MSTFDTQCYPDYSNNAEVPDFFQKTVDLFQTLPTYDWLAAANIYPSTTTQYTLAQFVAALQPMHSAIPYIGCSKGQVDELWYFYHVQGSLQTGNYVPTDLVGSQGCPDSFYYYPKGYSPPQATTTTRASSAAPSATSTGPPFTGKGFLYPADPTTGQRLGGFLISGGTYYAPGGTPAGYTSNSTTGLDSFTLATSKGACAVNATTNIFSCVNGGPTSTFTAIGGLLAFNGNTTFGSVAVPTGTVPQVVYAGQFEPVPFVLQWS